MTFNANRLLGTLQIQQDEKAASGSITWIFAYIGWAVGFKEHPNAEKWRRAGQRVVEAALAEIERSDQ